jgi:HAD superfamily hydrolase (TIGR01509 family)
MVFPRPIRAVVFDMDGLLIDTEAAYRDVIIAVAAERGDDLPLSLFHRMIGTPNAGSFELLLAHFGPDFDAEGLFAASWVRFHEVVDLENILKAGVVELLDHLDQIGLPKAIATSSPREAVETHLGPSGVASRFDAIVTRGDYARGKPAPDPFLKAAERLGVDPLDCLALEDSHNGVRAAHAAGMMTVMVPDLLEATEEMQAKCVRIAESLHEVRDLIAAHA